MQGEKVCITDVIAVCSMSVYVLCHTDTCIGSVSAFLMAVLSSRRSTAP